jgi:ferredoxin
MPIMHSVYRESGTVTIHEQTCKQCAQCVRICPADVLVMEEKRVRVSTASRFGCIACGHCMMVCPQGSITVTGRGVSPEDLVELPPVNAKATVDALDALLRGRRSVRRFSDREVDAEVLERIIEMASSAPMGIPPWDVGCVVVNGRDKVQALAAEIVKGYEQMLKMFKPWVLKLMRPFLGRAKYEQFSSFILPLAEELVAARCEGRDTLFWDAPAVIVFHHSPYADGTDEAIACTYAMLAAESLGLGTTIIGSAPPILQRNKSLLARLAIPAGNKPATALIVGHPAAPFQRAIRRRFTSVSFA